MPASAPEISLVVLSWQVVESMRQGMSPREAAEDAMRRIARRVPSFVGAVVAVSKDGRHAGACYGWNFTYSVASAETLGRIETITVEPVEMPGRAHEDIIQSLA
jgi:N4-(beta-N-acetylglucosaminyl)-L-asparaginase